MFRPVETTFIDIGAISLHWWWLSAYLHPFTSSTNLGGSIGDVFVTWEVDKESSAAEAGKDFLADGAQLSFPFGVKERGAFAFESARRAS